MFGICRVHHTAARDRHEPRSLHKTADTHSTYVVGLLFQNLTYLSGSVYTVAFIKNVFDLCGQRLILPGSLAVLSAAPFIVSLSADVKDRAGL